MGQSGPAQHATNLINGHLRHKRDRRMARLVAFGGYLILLTLGALIWQLFSEASVLLATPKAQWQQRWQLPEGYQPLYLDALAKGKVLLLHNRESCRQGIFNGQLDEFVSYQVNCTQRFSVQQQSNRNYLATLRDKGLLRVERLDQFGQQSQRRLVTSVAISAMDTPPLQWQFAINEQQLVVAWRDANGWQLLWQELPVGQPGKLQSIGHAQAVWMLPKLNLSLVLRDNNLQVVSRDGQLRQRLALGGRLTFLQPIASGKGFLAALDDGRLLQYSVLNQQGKLIFQPVYQLATEVTPIAMLSGGQANASVLLTKQEQLLFYNHTSGEIIARQDFAPKTQALAWLGEDLYAFSNDEVSRWQLQGMSGITSWHSLWGSLWYQGYAAPAYVWQNGELGGGEQAKFSLVPLFVGSLKAAFLALLVAIPLAMSAAIYTAYFAAPAIRHRIKPVLESLEAIPSVLLGFLAALWLTPMAEMLLLGLLLFVLVLPVSLWLLALVHHRLLRRVPRQYRHRLELLLALAVVILTFVLSRSLANILLPAMQDFAWFTQSANSTLVVALALGVAIVPGIYSLTDDALAAVPDSLKQASLALGATRLQTLRSVVILVAMPGMLSAIVLGFGRALGETMILLMVTGNAPIVDWYLLSDLRSLTANLAIELPEAHVDSSHYHILFLSALLLFCFTFLLSGFAEWLRWRLRRRVKGV